MNTSLALTTHIMTRIQELESIAELHHDKKPYLVLTNPENNQKMGSVRVFEGTDIIDKVVRVHLTVEALKLDAYMISVFTKSGSLYPHLVFDTEFLPHDSAFHIDLLHKCEFSTNIPYIKSVMSPLTDAFNDANNNEYFRFSDATQLMKALLNPWMASYHCLPEHLDKSKPTIDAYLDHWLSLKQRTDEDIVVNTQHCDNVAAFDAKHRDAIFDPRVDVLWEMIANLIGQKSRDAILTLLKGK